MVRSTINKQILGVDKTLLMVVAVLLATGVIMVFSASVGVQGSSANEADRYFDMFRRTRKHIASILIGLLVLTTVSFIKIQAWQKYSRSIFLFVILLLAMLFVPGIGREINGSTRWFSIGSFGLQPAEFLKVTIILFLSDYLVRNKTKIKSFITAIIKPALPLGLVSFLCLLQPDYGSTVLVLFVALGILFLSGVRLIYIGGAIFAVCGTLFLLIFFFDHALTRLLCYQDPFADATGCGYQLVQALIAVGSGEWFGVGLGSSVQKLFYIPHANNDFLVAVIAEELGFFGIAILVLLYGVLLWRIFEIARKSFMRGDLFSALVAQGIGLLLIIQMMIHFAVNFGVVPTKGLTMPLMSAGGSSMVASCFAVGLLFSIDRANRDMRKMTP